MKKKVKIANILSKKTMKHEIKNIIIITKVEKPKMEKIAKTKIR